MHPQPFDIENISPAVGAYVRGLDLTQPLGADVKEGLVQTLAQRGVICFRQQFLDEEMLIALGEAFGPLYVHPAPSVRKKNPQITNVHTDENSKSPDGENWHSDGSFDENPPFASILHLTELPPSGGGDTMFASAYAAYESLSPEMKHFAERLNAVHDCEVLRGRYDANDKDKVYPSTVHPVVCVHPITRRKFLFVNRVYTTRIVGLRPVESAAVLELLFRQVEVPEVQCRIRWAPGTVVAWDNRSAVHRAIWDYFPQRRFGIRVQVTGGKTIAANDAFGAAASNA